MLNNTTIHIALCANEKFSMPLGVCLTSIFESNKDLDIVAHILSDGISNRSKEIIVETGSRYNKKVDIQEIDHAIFNKFPLSTYFPQTIYYRYLLPDLLPKVDKVLYLDCDTIVMGDLSDLWQTDLTDIPLAAVPDANADDINERNRIQIWDGGYFNSGVLLMNLDYWRKNDCFTKLREFILKYPERCEWPDQDALNVLFHDDVLFLSFRYNFQLILSESQKFYRLHSDYQKDIFDSFSDLRIIHYSSSEQKPWYSDADHPMALLWKYFYIKSQWGENHLTPRYSLIKKAIKSRLHMKPFDRKPLIRADFMEIYQQICESYKM